MCGVSGELPQPGARGVVEDLAEDARALSADAEADLKVLEVEDPELAAHIRKTLKDQIDVIDSPEPKAIEAAMRCLINE